MATRRGAQDAPQSTGNDDQAPPQGTRDGSSRPSASVREAAVERREEPKSVQIAKRYEGQFAEVLPSFIEPKGFIGSAVAALRKDPDLLAAANNDLTRFVGVLIECARLGHVPGSKEYYLTVRNEKAGNSWVPKVMGIEGYRGVIDRMFRSGGVASVIVREVCKGDAFDFVEGVDDVPRHTIPWFNDDLDRADPENIIGVYAYARLTTGATSRVVVLNRKDLDRAKEQSDLGKKGKGPWVTSYRAMAWKTAAHRLEPWVPTSSEYRAENLRAVVAANKAAEDTGVPAGVDPTTGEVNGDVVDAEVVE